MIMMCWVLSHTGFSENDKEDKTKKSTLDITTEKKVYNAKYRL